MRNVEKPEIRDSFSGVRYGYEGITAAELAERHRIEAERSIPGELNWRSARTMEIHPDDLDALEAMARRGERAKAD